MRFAAIVGLTLATVSMLSLLRFILETERTTGPDDDLGKYVLYWELLCLIPVWIYCLWE